MKAIFILGIVAHLKKAQVTIIARSGIVNLTVFSFHKYEAILGHLTVTMFIRVEDIRTHDGVHYRMNDRVHYKMSYKSTKPGKANIKIRFRQFLKILYAIYNEAINILIVHSIGPTVVLNLNNLL